VQLSDSAIIPENVPARFFAEHFKPYEFAAKFIKDKIVLEVGCGDGYGAEYLSRYAKEVVAVDHAKENIMHAQNRYRKPNLTFEVMNAGVLGFENDSFDAACSFQVVEHIPENNVLYYLSEIKRVLKKGGVFYLSTLNVAHTMKSPHTYKKNPDHCKEYRLTELKELLSKVFAHNDVYGLHLTPKHRFYLRLKKMGIINFFPSAINPLKNFYSRITTDDFIITAHNLEKATDFICVCRE
jgi:ubiquinone/menaquinone biosynthesis C-methylase UbiE